MPFQNTGKETIEPEPAKVASDEDATAEDKVEKQTSDAVVGEPEQDQSKPDKDNNSTEANGPEEGLGNDKNFSQDPQKESGSETGSAPATDVCRDEDSRVEKETSENEEEEEDANRCENNENSASNETTRDDAAKEREKHEEAESSVETDSGDVARGDVEIVVTAPTPPATDSQSAAPEGLEKGSESEKNEAGSQESPPDSAEVAGGDRSDEKEDVGSGKEMDVDDAGSEDVKESRKDDNEVGWTEHLTWCMRKQELTAFWKCMASCFLASLLFCFLTDEQSSKLTKEQTSK